LIPEIFSKGGPIMWPLFAASVVSLAIVLERLFFYVSEGLRRDPQTVDAILKDVADGNVQEASRKAAESRDFVARALAQGLSQPKSAAPAALAHAAKRELDRFDRGLSTLDTIVTLAPLLGLLGTVTGMIRSFGLLGGRELDAPAVITGGIAEALIATAFGLGIAILALVPLNFLNTRFEKARRDLEDAGTRLELLLKA